MPFAKDESTTKKEAIKEGIIEVVSESLVSEDSDSPVEVAEECVIESGCGR